MTVNRASTLQVWITGGGTREPIDDVRYIGNRSTGRLSVSVAEECLRRGHQVRLLIACDVLAPPQHPRLQVERFETSRELQLLLECGPVGDALIHAAAVADYAPEAVSGKVPSSEESWTLRMVRQPKVVDAVRSRWPDLHLTLFKLESNIEAAELIARARRAGERVAADQIFANLLQEVGDGHHGGWLVPRRPQQEALRVESREAAAQAILDQVESSFSNQESKP